MNEVKKKEKLNKSNIPEVKDIDNALDSKKLSFINEITQTPASQTKLTDLLKNIMSGINALLNPETQIVHLFDSRNLKVESYFSDNRKKPNIKNSPFPIDEKAVIKIMENAKTTLISPNDTEGSEKLDIISLTKKTPNTVLYVPIINRGETFGVIELINKVDNTKFNESDILTINSVKNLISVVIANHILHEKTLELSIIDDVSGLYNLRHFKEILKVEIERAKRTLNPFSLIFFDLDFFKKINATYGHLVGSSVLNEVGKLLSNYLRKIDISARYGGDEFVIILPQTDETSGKIVAERLRRLISNTSFSGRSGSYIKITASFGISTYPIHSTDPEMLIELADKAMYIVKNSGRNGVIIYSK